LGIGGRCHWWTEVGIKLIDDRCSSIQRHYTVLGHFRFLLFGWYLIEEVLFLLGQRCFRIASCVHGADRIGDGFGFGDGRRCWWRWTAEESAEYVIAVIGAIVLFSIVVGGITGGRGQSK